MDLVLASQVNQWFPKSVLVGTSHKHDYSQAVRGGYRWEAVLHGFLCMFRPFGQWHRQLLSWTLVYRYSIGGKKVLGLRETVPFGAEDRFVCCTRNNRL